MGHTNPSGPTGATGHTDPTGLSGLSSPMGLLGHIGHVVQTGHWSLVTGHSGPAMDSSLNFTSLLLQTK